MKNYLLPALAVMMLAACDALKETTAQTPAASARLQVCPDEWIENAMPGPDTKGGPAKEYFILEGKRRELSEFDLEWVKKNCKVQKQTVY